MLRKLLNLPFGEIVEFEKTVEADENEEENAEGHQAKDGDLVPVGETQERAGRQEID